MLLFLERCRATGAGFCRGAALPIWISRGVRRNFARISEVAEISLPSTLPRDATFIANEIYAIATRGIGSDYAYFRGDEARERETRTALPAFEASEFDTFEEVIPLGDLPDPIAESSDPGVKPRRK
jgi:hypothetical protein